MSDELGRLADFVRRGQAAQAAVDELTVDRLTPQLALDAMKIGARVGTIVRLLDDAAAHREHRRHTNAASLEQLARAELKVLASDLDLHFRRFAPDVTDATA